MDVVVVFPCVPATATTRRPAITAAKACDRCSTSNPSSRARTSSGFVSRTADDTTTERAPSRCALSCPTQMVAPSSRSPDNTAESLVSLPLTARPRSSMIRATPDIPTPPIAMKCTGARPSTDGTSNVRSGFTALSSSLRGGGHAPTGGLPRHRILVPTSQDHPGFA
jgi:hypothetical protein